MRRRLWVVLGAAFSIAGVILVKVALDRDATRAHAPPSTIGRIAFSLGQAGVYVMDANGRRMTKVADRPASYDWSPEHSTLAFYKQLSCCRPQIFVVNADGSGLRALTRAVTSVDPVWSPDGKSIAFERQRPVSDVDVVSEIVVMDADGGRPRVLARGGDPSWSPDGRKLTFELNANCYVINADGRGKLRLVSRTARSSCVTTWAPDSSRIAYRLDCAAFVINADGSGRRRLTDPPEGLCDRALTWSPDGTKIAFEREHRRDTADIRDIHVVTLDAGEVKKLTDFCGLLRCDSEFDLAWSPDSAKIAFVRVKEDQDETIESDVYVVNADGSERRRLPSAADENLEPTWSPDGRSIAFTCALPRLEICVINWDGSGFRRLTATGGDAWGLEWFVPGAA
jgi:Tol biopolymer transport system component